MTCIPDQRPESYQSACFSSRRLNSVINQMGGIYHATGFRNTILASLLFHPKVTDPRLLGLVLRSYSRRRPPRTLIRKGGGLDPPEFRLISAEASSLECYQPNGFDWWKWSQNKPFTQIFSFSKTTSFSAGWALGAVPNVSVNWYACHRGEVTFPGDARC